jgi:Ala-tRNA(Pro) deacylase
LIQLAEIFTQERIDFELYHHRPIYTNEDAVVVKEEQGFHGTETKSLYLKDKQNNRYIFLTFTTKRSDFKKLSQLVGQRISVVSADQMEQETGQKPGAVSPFGYETQVPVIVDEELLSHEKLVFALGRPDQTMVVKVADLEKISQILGLKMYLLPQEK